MDKGVNNIQLSIIIINFNSIDYIKLLIKSILKFVINIKYEIIIIDNNSNDEISSLKLISKNVITFKLNKNIGFAAANNYGVSKSNGEYLYFLNPDTEILDYNTNILLYNLINDSKIGIVAPQILNSDFSLQYNARLNPNIFSILLFTFGFNKFFKVEKLYDYKMKYFDHNNILNPDWVSGAGFMISYNLFYIINGFDERYFFYYEDLDICRKVRKLDLQIKCYNNVRIKHYAGGSSKDIIEFTEFNHMKSRFIFYKLNSSIFIYYFIKLITHFNLILRSVINLFFLRLRVSKIYMVIFMKLVFQK
jgi:GT2 family glycosyltransferase